MRFPFVVVSLVCASVLLFGLSASAAPKGPPAKADCWYGNSDASCSGGVVTLSDENTAAGSSWENANLKVPLKGGDKVSYQYRLGEGDKCEAGAPRLFVAGGAYNTENNCGTLGEDGWYTVEAFLPGDTQLPSDGEGTIAGHTGLVNDNFADGGYRAGTIEFRNLVIADTPVPLCPNRCKNIPKPHRPVR